MGYIFDPEKLNAIVQASLKPKTATLEQKFDKITTALKQTWPEHIDDGPRQWIFNNAGGAMGQMHLLHASLTEYVILFGTPIGTEGHSGRYSNDVYDIMIEGEVHIYLEGDLDKVVAVPGGDYLFLGKGKAKGYKIPDQGGWMLEYSRGVIPAMLPFGLADTLFSTLDAPTFVRTFGRYGKLVTKELLQGKI